MLTNEQLLTIIAATTAFLSGLSGLVWKLFNRWLDDRKEDRGERRSERDASTQATVAVAKAMTEMSLRFEAFEKQLRHVEGVVDEVADEVTGRHEIPVHKPTRAATDPGYRAPKRPRQDT